MKEWTEVVVIVGSEEAIVGVYSSYEQADWFAYQQKQEHPDLEVILRPTRRRTGP